MNSKKIFFGIALALIALSALNFAALANNTTATYSLSVSASPSNGGVVTGSASNLPNGSVRTITATPSAGYNFTKWNVVLGSCSIMNAYAKNTTVAVNGNCYVVANFNAAVSAFDLSVSVTPTGSGNVTGNATRVPAGSIMPITATPNSGYSFAYFYSSNCQILNPYNRNTYVNVTSNCMVWAQFNATPVTYTLTANATMGGYVSPTSQGGIAYGATVSVLATPAAFYVFDHWDMNPVGNCLIRSQSATRTNVTVYGNCAVTAYFNSTMQYYSLSVSASPSNGGVVTGSASNLPNGSVRTITATPSAGYNFTKWNVVLGSCSIMNAYAKNTTVAVNGNCYVVGNFSQMQASKPDLIISRLTLNGTVYVNQRVYGSLETKNNGSGISANSTTTYYINGVYVNAVAVPSLAAGQASAGTITFICTRAGTYVLRASADTGSAVPETNETNNAKEITFVCGMATSKIPIAAKAQQSYVYASIFDDLGSVLGSLAYLLGFGR